ncbi:MAG TPA: cation-translocating P-type ATPase [Candidatus Paceibacterota bacterium]|nr:cation-translocating P-type ATPase [Candidatus Paceibacterota bacterium]
MNMLAHVRQSFDSPRREFLIAPFLAGALILEKAFAGSDYVSFVNNIIWAVAILGALPLLFVSVQQLYRREITIEVFNLFALIVALVLNHPTAAVWIDLMLTFASYLEWRTKSRANNAIEELLRLRPEVAHRELSGDIVEDIGPEDVRVGDILVVKAGERIPVDGLIIFGEAIIDESSFTGESVPEEKTIGAEVYTATLLAGGVLKIRATQVGEDTTLARLLTLMRAAAVQKSKAQRFADKFAGIFLPIVALAGVLIYIFTRDPAMVAAFFLIICADDIAVAIPLAMEAGLGEAARRGVIIKGGKHVEALAKIRTVVFDKTGTLTLGKFAVDSVELAQGVPLRQFWQYVAMAEKFSEHPIGRAVYAEACKVVGEPRDPDHVEVLRGAGIHISSEGTEVVVGNHRALEASGIVLDGDARDCIGGIHQHGGKTILLVYVGGKYFGSIIAADTPKLEAKTALAQLTSMGIHTVMLTGDRKEVAEDIATTLGIEEYVAGLSPEDKLRRIAELSEQGVTAMVGDGINDAPALVRADIGIAMGSIGTAVAIEAADIIVLTDQLERIPEMIMLARRVRGVVWGNIGIWFVTNALGVFLVLTRFAGIPLAAAYNFGTDFLPLLNSSRLFRSKRGK